MLVSLNLNSDDINTFVDSAKNTSGMSSLNKMSRFKLRDDSLFFDQSFVSDTTVQVKLSCDGSGKLLITIIELTDNGLFNFFLDLNKRNITSMIESKTNHLLVKESDSVLSLSPKRMPFSIEFRNVEIKGDRLFVTAGTCPLFDNASGPAVKRRSRFAYFLLTVSPFVFFGINDYYAARYISAFIHILLSFFGCILSAIEFPLESAASDLAPILGVFLLLLNVLWAVFEVISVKKDGNGVPM